MANVLVLGVGPLPVDKTDHLHAPGIRVWQLAQVVHQQKHAVTVGVIEFGDFQDTHDATVRLRQEALDDRLSVCRFRYHSQRTPQALASLHTFSHFDCVVSTTDIMNDVAARIPVPLPLWLDYLGDPLTERQLQAAVYNNDVSLLDLWRVMAEALLHGDRFSVASTPQKFTIIGQLGLLGRLNEFTAANDMVHVIPNCPKVIVEKPRHIRKPLKGALIPADSFVLLWAGGYNTWSDPETLFQGLERAIRKDPSIYYVSLGGEIRGHDNVTFHRFRERCEKSDLAAHFHFLGWVPPSEVPFYYAQADAAINIDLPCYEAEIGTRTRIIDWIHYEIPVITTPLCEPARLLADRGLVAAFAPRNADQLCEAILGVKSNLSEARSRANQAKMFIDELFQQDKIFSPLLEWVENPRYAPDRRFAETKAQSGSQLGNFLPDSLLTQKHREWLERCARGGSSANPPGRAKSFLTRLLQKLRKNS